MYYPSQTLEDIPTAVDSGIPYFTLAVHNHDKSECININFSLLSSTNTTNEDYSLILTPRNDTRDIETDELIENAVTFSASQIVLNSDCVSVTFEFYIADGYAFEEVVCVFDCYTLEINQTNNTCTVSLTEELTKSLDYVLKFKAYPVLHALTITPIDSSGLGLIIFSQDKILLDEGRTSAIFNYYLALDYMYEVTSCEYPSEHISVSIDKENSTCIVTLNKNPIEDLSIEVKFNVIKLNVLSITFVDGSHDNVITFISLSDFPPDSAVLSAKQSSLTFGYSVAEGYELSDYSTSYSYCTIVVNAKSNTFTITLVEDLTSNKNDTIYFYAVEEINTLILAPRNDTRDIDTGELIENAVTFSVSEIVLSADCTSATFEFFIADGYAFEEVVCVFDCYTLEIDEENGTCTVSLTEGLTEDLDYVLKFKAYKL